MCAGDLAGLFDAPTTVDPRDLAGALMVLDLARSTSTTAKRCLSS